jgi:LPXTG-motif cell wall-anchored protein
MNYLKYTQYVYLVAAFFFAYKSISVWNEATDEHFLFLGIALLSVFMFFFRRKFAKKFEARNESK